MRILTTYCITWPHLLLISKPRGLEPEICWGFLRNAVFEDPGGNQSCSVSRETFDLTVTRGILWFDKV